MRKTENEYLQELLELEDLAIKKTAIYGRLLIEPSLAQDMEELSSRHETRKEKIQRLLYGEDAKKGGTSATKGENKGK